MLIKIMAATFIVIVSFFIGIALMVYGWGLQPQSWPWIIGMSIAGLVVTMMANVVNKFKV